MTDLILTPRRKIVRRRDMEVNATLLIQLCLFLGLLAWLSKFLFAPMLHLFEERERRIQGAKVESLELQKQAKQRLEEVEARIQDAQKEARMALIALQAEGARYHREILESARQQAAQQMREASENLKNQVEQIRQELVPTQADLSKQVITRLLGERKITHMEHTHA